LIAVHPQQTSDRNKVNFTMETDSDLPTLIQQKDHLNVLRYIRVHELREPELVLTHGKAFLGPDLKWKKADDLARLASLEQICLAAVDKHDHETAQECLAQLRGSGVAKESSRFRLLLARCLETAGDDESGESGRSVYEELLTDNPANLMALKRKYCLLKSQVGKETEAMHALNEYLKQNYSDTAAWYELAKLRMELGDYKGAAFGLEEVLIGFAADPKLHCELAECYATIGDLEHLGLARKHMAQALELDPSLRRAQFGLVSVANAYLEESETAGKKNIDEFEIEVAKELVKYGAEQVLKSYKGSSMFPSVKTLMSEYTDSP
jgi:tetratricopeptide (TPR) repeat protein